MSTSVGGTLTGRGGNFVIIDDPMKAQDTFLRISAGDRLGMVRTHSSLPARQQGGGLNCGGDAAASCR